MASVISLKDNREKRKKRERPEFNKKRDNEKHHRERRWRGEPGLLHDPVGSIHVQDTTLSVVVPAATFDEETEGPSGGFNHPHGVVAKSILEELSSECPIEGMNHTHTAQPHQRHPNSHLKICAVPAFLGVFMQTFSSINSCKKSR